MSNKLGKIYQDGEEVIRQGDTGNTMYVILSGKVEVVRVDGDKQVKISELEKGEIFGEMALFENMPRSATIRSVGESRIITVDKRTFFSRVHEDPSLAFNMMKEMSQRINRLNKRVVELEGQK